MADRAHIAALGVLAVALSAPGAAASPAASCPEPLPVCAGEGDRCCARAFGAGSVAIRIDPDAGDQRLARSYGLIYRLVQHGVPVYWLARSGDEPAAWVRVPGRDPVALPGGSFVVAAEDRARFDALRLGRGDFAELAGDPRYDFSAVEPYELPRGARIVRRGDAGAELGGAPVALVLDHAPPRMARLASGGAAAPWLARAGLDEPADYPACLTGAFSPPTAVYCDVTESDVEAGYLVQGELSWVWVQRWADEAPCGELDELVEFLTAVPGVRAGGHVLLSPRALGAIAGCAGRRSLGEPAADRSSRLAGVPANGVVAALPAGGDRAGARALFEAMLALPAETVPQRVTENVVEVARSAPVLASLDGARVHVQGTLERLDPEPGVTSFAGAAGAATFVFPHVTGHVRGYGAARVGGADAAFGDVAALFDAADGIPPPEPDGCATEFSAACRTVFTVVAGDDGGARRVVLSTAAAPALRPLLGAGLSVSEAATLIARVLAGHQRDGVYVPRLGGVDRSTPAVIGPSPVIRGDRPTLIYVGALDGMLHAVCAEARGACDRAGRELWAFVPPSQLPLLRRNAGRVDGSPRVTDVFADFDGDGANEWRTVLALQTGGRTPGVYALDVTDPTDPLPLWEVTEVGVGLGLAIGPVADGIEARTLVFALTSARDPERAGFELVALDAASGEVVWRVARDYPEPRDPANPPPPATGLPGGATALDLARRGSITHVAAPTLYGDVWLFEAPSGDNPFGDEPLFRFGTDFHPIGAPAAAYRTGGGARLHLVVGTGGFADPVATSWSPDEAEQYLVSVPVSLSAEAPLDETTAAFAIGIGAGTRVYAQPTVAGNELFAPADTADVNLDTYGLAGSTGTLTRVGLADRRRIGVPVTLAGGACSVDATSTGVVHNGAAWGARRLDYGASFDAGGEPTELGFTPRTGREVWLRMR